jgi:hypothetical protein
LLILAAAEVAAAAMAALLIAEEAKQKQAPPSKHGNSNKARKQRSRRKTNSDELETDSKGHDEGLGGRVASSIGMRDGVGERDDTARDGQSHNEPEGSIGRNVQRLEASSVEREAGASHSEVEQPPITQAERRQKNERERKGKQRQRKTKVTTQATLEEALARVDTARASLDTLNALDVAIVCAKQILEHGGASSSTDAPVVPSAGSDLPRLLRQAEEKALNLSGEIRARAKATAYDLLEEGLVRSAVAESSTHIQEQQQSVIEPPPSAIASAENGNTLRCVFSGSEEHVAVSV